MPCSQFIWGVIFILFCFWGTGTDPRVLYTNINPQPFYIWGKVSLNCSGGTQIWDLPAAASQMLGLQACVTALGLVLNLTAIIIMYHKWCLRTIYIHQWSHKILSPTDFTATLSMRLWCPHNNKSCLVTHFPGCLMWSDTWLCIS